MSDPKPNDPFSSVPNAPNFIEATPEESTNAILAKTGAHKSSYGKLVAGLAVLAVVIGIGIVVAARYAGEQTQVNSQQRAEAGSNIDWSKIDPAEADRLRGQLNGDARRAAEEEARRRAAQQAARNAAANNAARHDIAGDVSPEDLAMLLAAQGDKPRGTTNGPKLVADSAMDVNKSRAGALSDKVVADKIAKAQPALSQCISTALRRNPNLKAGRVKITASIAPSGIVTKAAFDKADLGDTDVGECLRKVVKGLVFPPFEGDPFDVEIPLTIGAAQ